MVFESVVTDVLNRVLGDYVENLDSKQLNIGIWGGDVVLKNLILKQSALDDLDLPVETVYGRLGSLVLKIPWKNLYGSAVEVNIEGLYLLVVPNQQVKYDPVKEEKRSQENKQTTLLRIENAKKKEAEKDKPKTDDTFVEKLTTQIIKNVQLKIKDIHIRYEDKVTHTGHPFALGISLSNLTLQTTDDTWNPTIVQQMVTKIYKVVSLEGLAVYWNCNSSLYANLPSVDLMDKFQKEIATRNEQPENYSYILGPINSSARLRLNPKPEMDTPAFIIPKIHLNLYMEKLAVGISKSQYRDIIALAESMDRMSKGVPFRKFRPDVQSYKGHYKEWWQFAYKCILEQEITRKKNNWDWTHICEHRKLCKSYGQAYQLMLQNKKVSTEIKEKIEVCEKTLDLFNIVLIRQRIELEVARLTKKEEEVKKSKSWFGSWWGRTASEDDKNLTTATDIQNNDDAVTSEFIKKFEEAMTPEEKQRLYKAIDYQENSAPTEYPEAYVDTACSFILHMLEVTLRDDEYHTPIILNTELKDVKCRLDTRAAASAIKVAVNVGEFITYGLKQNNSYPQLITTDISKDNCSLLDVVFETNPLGNVCGQSIIVNAEPLKIVYDAQTIIRVVNIFKITESSALDQLSEAAGNKLSNIKEMSAIGLQHAIEQHTKLDLKIDLHAPYIIIPYGGQYAESENVLVVNLGSVKVFSDNAEREVNVRQLHATGAKNTEIMEKMIAKSYDKFLLEFTGLQIIVAQGGEDWQSCLQKCETTDMHLLNPVNFNMTFFKCLITDDPRLPLTKIRGELPSVEVNVSDARLLHLLSLGLSIPLPSDDVPENKPLTKESKLKGSSMMMLKYIEMQEKARVTKELLPDLKKYEEKDNQFVQFTTVDVQFVMSELTFKLNHQEDLSSPVFPVASFKATYLEFDLIQQTYNTNIAVRLASIGMQHYRSRDVAIICTPPSTKQDQYLFEVNFIQVDKKSPEFHSKYQSCESLLKLKFDTLELMLHQESLQELFKFITELQLQVDEICKDSASTDHLATAHSDTKRRLSVVSETSSITTAKSASKTMITSRKPKKSNKIVIETIIFKLNANLHELIVKFTSDACDISSCAIKGISSDVLVKKSYTQITAKLLDITVKDLNPLSIHDTILTVIGKEAINAQVVLYNDKLLFDLEPNVDMSVQVNLGHLRIVFLNWFVSNMLNFLNKFQAAQQTIIEASQAAAQTAKLNMQNAYENATKISLNIDLTAPDIVVPANSKSYDALFLNLGHITLANQFMTLEVKNERGDAVVLDELKMNLTDFKLERVVLNKSNEVVEKNELLEPVTFTVSVKRNLSVAWYRSVPDIEIFGKLDTVKLLLNHMDYQMAMKVLNGNLNEGITTKPPESETPMQADANKIMSAPSTTDQANLKEETETISPATVDAKVNTFLKFTFSMESFIISLFTSTNKLTSQDSCEGLATFSLEGLSIKGRILSDNSLVASILLVNCLLDDMRKGRKDKLNRLIERTQDNLGIEYKSVSQSTEFALPTRSMLDITYQQKDNNMFVDVRVYSFTTILSVDYLSKVAEFFTSGFAQNSEIKPPERAAAKTQSTSKTAVVPTATKSVTAQDIQTNMTVNLKIEKPDIVLVEHMDNIDTNALILNCEVLVKLRMSGDHQVINGTVKDFQLYTCCYNPLKRYKTRGSVLEPVSLSVAGSTPENKGLHLDVLMTDVRISVSPATIELLNRCSVTMSGGTTQKSDEESELIDRSDLWNYRPFSDKDFWFLKPDVADDALVVIGDKAFNSASVGTENEKLKEMCIVSIPSIVITLESGVGNKTLPLLLLSSSFQGTVNDWSSQMFVEASLTLQMAYYNSSLALWEPLIEPVEIVQEDKTVTTPWELKLEYSMCEQEELTTSPSVEGDIQEVQMPQTAMCIDISSKNNLELTVTKTCLEVLNNLSKAFSEAMQIGEVTHSSEFVSAYKVKNDTGIPVTLCLDKSAFKVFNNEESEQVILESGAEVPLVLNEPSDIIRFESETMCKSLIKDRYLHVTIAEKKCDLDLPVVRADKRFFLLNYRAVTNDTWGIISSVKVEDGVTIITLRSILQVHNHFNVPVEIFYMTARGNELESIAIIEPGSFINLPLKAVYTQTNELFFSVAGFSVTAKPFVWKDLQLNFSITNMLYCSPKNTEDNKEPFIIKVIGEIEQVYHENTTRHTMASTCFNIHLRPAISLKNCLPIDIICCVQNIVGEKTVQPGKSLQLPNVDPGKSSLVIRLPEYLEKEWSCRHEIPQTPPPFSVWTFDSHDSACKMSLDLGMHVLNKNGSILMSLYCPFWMLNKTGIFISYRKSKKTEKNEAAGSPAKNSDENLNVMHHPPTFKGPMLFSFNAKNFFGKKKASIRLEQGEWSDKFSIDVAGSSGVVLCKANNLIYQIGVSNQLTYNGLTKQVTFTPYYVIINNASFAIECQELNRPADAWTRVEPKACTALWPRSDQDDKLLKLRVVDTNDISAPFLFTESHTTLLKLPNMYGGINVDIQLTEGAVYINLTSYNEGMAPALIINHTRDTMNFWEKETVQIRKLLPNHCFLYTWANPSGSRVFVWEIGHKKELEDDLRKDGVGEFSPTDDYKVYWVSFLDGMQRVLLFTSDKTVAEDAQSAKQFEVTQQEINVSIHGMGLSLVNNLLRQEIMYVGIASSGIIWEACKPYSKRFKQMNPRDSANMESAYQHYMTKQAVSTMDFGRALIDNKTEVDFETGYILKPHKKRIRRTFQTGLWIQMKSSPHQLQLHAKINRLQIDNQMYDCIFPVVLAPVPPPKSVTLNVHKPFAELSIVQLLMKNSQVRQFKYFKVLIQEFHVKVDLGFINAMVEVLEAADYTEQEDLDQFLKDMSLVDEPLFAHVSTQSLQEQKSFYDLLHFSPLKIHVSFSIASGGSSGQNTAAAPNFLNVLLQGLGVTLTDLQDVVFKLAYFEREYTFLTQRQLISEATDHYVGQTVKQLYVLVLGLDVLGNPYGLVLGITKGVEDLFYEPFQGAIQGPGEFAEGLVLGVRSLFGHTVGGAAGAVSRITGAMGKGIAALTFDKDYQRKRREQINKKPTSMQEGIARGGKGLVMGVFDGVTGVFTKPISGAKEQGVEGFFKGLGKGAVGLVTRPTAGVIDFASGSFDAVKRATDLGEEANRLRAPRFLQADCLVRPYNCREAEGHKLLTELEKGKYATTDIYVYHYVIIEKKEMLMLTDKRLAYITHNDLFGGWQLDWSYTWQEIQNPPKIIPKGICIITSENKKKKSFFGSSDSGKIILISNASARNDIFEKIEELRGN